MLTFYYCLTMNPLTLITDGVGGILGVAGDTVTGLGNTISDGIGSIYNSAKLGVGNAYNSLNNPTAEQTSPSAQPAQSVHMQNLPNYAKVFNASYDAAGGGPGLARGITSGLAAAAPFMQNQGVPAVPAVEAPAGMTPEGAGEVLSAVANPAGFVGDAMNTVGEYIAQADAEAQEVASGISELPGQMMEMAQGNENLQNIGGALSDLRDVFRSESTPASTGEDPSSRAAKGIPEQPVVVVPTTPTPTPTPTGDAGLAALGAAAAVPGALSAGSGLRALLERSQLPAGYHNIGGNMVKTLTKTGAPNALGDALRQTTMLGQQAARVNPDIPQRVANQNPFNAARKLSEAEANLNRLAQNSRYKAELTNLQKFAQNNPKVAAAINKITSLVSWKAAGNLLQQLSRSLQADGGMTLGLTDQVLQAQGLPDIMQIFGIGQSPTGLEAFEEMSGEDLNNFRGIGGI